MRDKPTIELYIDTLIEEAISMNPSWIAINDSKDNLITAIEQFASKSIKDTK